MAACKKLAEEFNVSDRVIFLGMRSDIPALLKTADIVVLSSNYEGLSLSSVEGMASGNPFIASDVPGLQEVVGGAGLLFEAGNEKELASHILHLMEDKTYRDSIAAACEERAAQYDIQEMVEKHVALYKEWCP
jgi:glycosyltransferase involved in cell wall biosynthesis